MALKQNITGALPNDTIVATGLNTSPNPLNTPDGSLKEAVDVIIRRDNVIEPRRGFALFGDTFGSTSDTCKQLAVYRTAILRHFSTSLQFQNGTNNDGSAKFSTFSGSYSEPTAGIRIKYIEANGNFYFTTSNGVYKISAASASDFTTDSGYITKAGGIKAIDFKARLSVTQGDQSSFFVEDSTVAYRCVWGTTDANNQLLLGTPSPFIQVYNPLLSLLLLDFLTLLEILNNLNQSGSMITFGNYVNTWKLASSATASQLYTNLDSVCTQIDTDLYYANATGSGVPLTIATDRTASVSSADAPTDVITTSASHNLSVGYVVRFTGGSLPAGLSAGVNYYVISTPSGTTFKVSASKGGTSVDITGTGTGTVNFFGAFDNGSQQYIITFSSGTPSNYLSVGDYVNLSGFTSAGTGNINGQWKLTAVDSNSITFTVGASTTGNNVTTSGQIHSYKYTHIFSGYTAPSTTATNNDLISLQNLINDIITKLKSEPNSAISSGLVSTYITPFALTKNAQVILNINIPQDVNANWFLQIYKTKQVTAIGTDVLANLSPGDEEQQMYEAYPTSAELAAGVMTVTDNVTDAFLGSGTYLYTNQITGQGISQANDIPPLSQDINIYKNYTFFANTQTRYKKLLTLIGVSNMISDYNAGKTPKVMIGDTSASSTYSFTPGVAQVTTVTTVLAASVTDGSYFTFNSALNTTKYYAWFYKGAGTDPALSGYTGIKVDLTVKTPSGSSITSAADVANRLCDVLASALYDFSTSVSSSTVTITNTNVGYTSAPADGTSPKNTTFTITVTVSGAGENITKQVTKFTCPAESGGNYLSGGVGKYFTINTAFDRNQYYVWFSVSGSGSDPAISGKTGVKVSFNSGDNATTIGNAIVTALTGLSNKFTAVNVSGVVTVTNYYYGPATNATAGTSPLTSFSTVTSGSLSALLSTSSSPAIAIDLTARSLVRAINLNNYGDVYAFYISGPTDTPGQMYIESRALGNPVFYLLGNDSNTGASFNPDLSPTYSITGASGTVSAANPSVVTISNHGFTNGQQVVLANSNTSPNVDGVYTITFLTSNTFSIPVSVTTSGNQISAILASNAQSADNSVAPNRLFYSKLQQPEAVPSLNYIDIGAQDQAILRIFPLRDSLFVFKEDGLYRLSGETAPFNVALFDQSAVLIAPDSIGLVSNTIYAWTTQGISIVTESGVEPISRPIDNLVLPITIANYPNFKTATWGIGYQSDSSYMVWTVSSGTNSVATQAFRYNILTNTWTTFNKTNTCGIVNITDDKLYLGAGNANQIEQERKNFNRLDYSDWEYTDSLNAGNLNSTLITLPSVSNYDIGDVIAQTQTLTIYEYNTLLKKLDKDLGINDPTFYSGLVSTAGDQLRDKLTALATKLDNEANLSIKTYSSDIAALTGTITDNTAASSTVITSAGHRLKSGRYINITGSTCVPNMDGKYVVTVIDANTFSIPFTVTSPGTHNNDGSWSTLETDFNDIEGCFNIITANLNLDSGTIYKNYPSISTTTLLEAIITGINRSTKVVTLNLALPYVQGTLTVYKAINAHFTYNPITFSDPMSYKHIREAQALFENKAFTNGTVSFASDLLPAFQDVPFNGDGNGIFGFQSFGSGFFGGNSNAAPFRTYIPRTVQRCRYLNIRFSHKVAREKFSLLGFTLIGKIGVSSRAYR